MKRIDAHQHFWHYDADEYAWIGEGMETLRRDFLPDALAVLLAADGFEGSIAVQARQTEAETRWLCSLADDHDHVLGVVGWVDLMADAVHARLDALQHDRLVGMRHVLQDEADDARIRRPEFRRGLAALADHGYCYDVLVYPRHLPHVLPVVEEFGALPFVVDHLAKPPIADGGLEGWREGMQRLAERPNVYCKVSGMVTEAAWSGWRPADFTAYLDLVFDAFGAERLMFGSDWPVCRLAADYTQVVALVADYMSSRTAAEREAVFGGTAAAFYGIDR